MPEDDLQPLVERLGPRERETLLSFYRFQWAGDMRGLYHKLLWDGPVGELKRAGLTQEQALERVKSDRHAWGLVVTSLYFFPYMSYYYGGMYAVVEAWRARLPYRDGEIDTLLQSPLVASLEQHRHGAFHFTPEYFGDRLIEFVSEPDSELWLDRLHAAFVRWFRYHLKLKPHEGPNRSI